MSDEWSLKGKNFFGYNSEGKVFASVLRKEQLQDMYNEDDIEILRNKLIEDFTERFGPEWDSYLDDALAIINKRFGVEK